ncbi:TIGR00180 family glycosyltransferase [Luminiphilus sp.]|nr:TIGR00180 family glycosyltransferase [Luminiphilus sp.]
MQNIIVVPTYNRPEKTTRVLSIYTKILSAKYKVVVLDGSEDRLETGNLPPSKTGCSIDYRHMPGRALNDRLLEYLSSVDEKKFIAMGNDEDIFLPGFLDEAFALTESTQNYVCVWGSYVTWQKKLFGLPRVSSWRNVILKEDISHSDPVQRCFHLRKVLEFGCAPVFWSVRPASIFIRSIEAFDGLKYGSAAEFVDQTLLPILGPVRLIDLPMLWRDETGQVWDERRDVYNVPIGVEADVGKVFKDHNIPNGAALAKILSIAYSPEDQAVPLWWRNFKSLYSAKNMSGDVFWGLAGWIEKIGVLVSEVFFAIGWRRWARKQDLKALL